MVDLVHIGTGYAPYDSLVWDIRALQVTGSGSAMRVYSATGSGGGLLAWAPNAGYTTIDYEYSTSWSSTGAQYQLELGALNGIQMLFYYGAANSQVTAYAIGDDGRISLSGTLPVGLTSVSSFEAVTLASGKTAVYATTNGSGLVIGYTANSVGSLSGTNFTDLSVIGQTSFLSDMTSVTVGGKTYLLALSMYGNTLTSLAVNDDGSTSVAGTAGISDGLAVNRLYRIEAVSLAGKTFALITATGTSSISVVEVGSDGGLRVRDQVNDDLSTRFQGGSALSVTTLDDRAYVVAAGADDGLSLFMLLPNGRLLHLQSIADTAGMALDNVSALAATGADGVLDIFATSSSEVGLTHLRYDPGEQAPIRMASAAGGTLAGDARVDLLWGGAGNDELYGHAGDDILYDGGGSDTLYGGAGSDTFVLAKDGRIDVIRDFNIAQDRLDLSEWGTIYSMAFLSVTATSYGMRIVYDTEDLRVYSDTGGALDPKALRFDQVSNAWHIVLNPPSIDAQLKTDVQGRIDLAIEGLDGGVAVDLSLQQIIGSWYGESFTRSLSDTLHVLGTSLDDDTIIGSGADNQLSGRGGRDQLFGLSGNDLLDGGDGADALYGGDGFDTIYGEAGNDTVFGGNGRDLVFLGLGDDLFNDNGQGGDYGRDTVYGGSGNDTIEGGNGDDAFFGELGNDVINGRLGNDVIDGGDGSDKLYGGDGFDTIYAGADNDTVYGGNGRDLVYLGTGNDLFNDNGQGGDYGRDTVYGGDGADRIEGGNGDDVFHGEAGNDVIFGRLGNDLITGGTGADAIYAGDGSDTVFADDGRDLVYLGNGNDLFNDNSQGGAEGRDTVFGGNGDDTIEGGNGDDVFYGEAGNDVIRARLGDDQIYGGDGFDFIDAGDGNDTVFGGNGRDRVLLGAGNDRFIDTAQTGELGQDTITGGEGADVFVFGAPGSADVITDFTLGVDALHLSRALVGNLSAAQVVSAYGSVLDGDLLLDFGGGNSILLENVASAAGLGADILVY